MNQTDIIWLSGLCEGEACFDLNDHKYPRIRIKMSDRDVIGRVATLWGSSVRLTLTAKGQPLWTTQIQGARAVSVMEHLLPYMGSRRSSKIAAILAVYRKVSTTAAYGGFIARPPGIAVPA